MVLQIGDSFSKLFQTATGVRQGGVMSPKLFSIYIEELLVKVDHRELGIYIGNMKISILAYADDILIMVTTKSDLQKQLSTIESYGKKFGIKFNPHKTELIIFNLNKKRNAHEIFLDSNQQEVLFDGKKIQISTTIKYLGSIINDDLSNHAHLSKRTRAAHGSG